MLKIIFLIYNYGIKQQILKGCMFVVSAWAPWADEDGSYRIVSADATTDGYVRKVYLKSKIKIVTEDISYNKKEN